MFYCHRCGERAGWPRGFSVSWGPCEICGRTQECSDVPSKYLPMPKEDHEHESH